MLKRCLLLEVLEPSNFSVCLLRQVEGVSCFGFTLLVFMFHAVSFCEKQKKNTKERDVRCL